MNKFWKEEIAGGLIVKFVRGTICHEIQQMYPATLRYPTEDFVTFWKFSTDQRPTSGSVFIYLFFISIFFFNASVAGRRTGGGKKRHLGKFSLEKCRFFFLFGKVTISYQFPTRRNFSASCGVRCINHRPASDSIVFAMISQTLKYRIQLSRALPLVDRLYSPNSFFRVIQERGDRNDLSVLLFFFRSQNTGFWKFLRFFFA